MNNLKAILVSFILFFLILSPLIFTVFLPNFKASRLERKQASCYHLWRRMDMEFVGEFVAYRYRCEKCAVERRLDSQRAQLFEKEFLSDDN